MSEFRISCPKCDQHIACDESHRGIQIPCPACGHILQIPVAAGSTPPSAAPHARGGLSISNTDPGPPPSPRAPRPNYTQQSKLRSPSKGGDQRWLITWLLSFFLGGLGIDRFYNGRTGLGVGKLLATILTCGTVGLIWAMIDFILLLAGKYQGAHGKYLKRPQGRYMTLQIVGILFSALGVGVCLLYAFWAVAIPIALINHSSFGPGQAGLPTTQIATTAPQLPLTVTTLEQWNQLQGPMMRTVTVVSAAPACPTGIMLTGNDQYQLYPCPTDTWNARPRRGQDAGWSDVDYQGHVEAADRTTSGRPYLQLCYRIGNEDLQTVQMGGIVSGRGLLVLVPSMDRGVQSPSGSIRVKIIKVSPTQFNQRAELPIGPMGAYVRDMKSEVEDSGNHAQRLSCVRQLSQLGVTFRMWAIDHGDQFPFNVPSGKGGTLDYCQSAADGFDANAFRHFQVLSNTLGQMGFGGSTTPKVLVCPADTSKTPAKDWESLDSSHVTYLLRSGPLLSEEHPEEVLARCPIHGNTLYCDGDVKQDRSR